MRALVLVALLAACSKPNPYYCEGHPANNCLLDASVVEPDAPWACTTSAECAGTTPVCTAAHECGPCAAHDQCGSQACLPTGACGDDTNVAYVSATGNDGGACTRDEPCVKITTAATKGRPYIKVQSDLDEAVMLNNANVTLLAAKGTVVRRSSSGAIFDIRGTSSVAIHDLTIRDGLGTTGHGLVVPFGEPVAVTLDHVSVINNAGVGISVQGGTVTMSRSIVSGNNSGGAYVYASFNITNSLFVANGNTLSSTGGVFLTPSGTVAFKFNTVANNTAMSGAVKGINCGLALTASNTIISGNDVSASCSFEYSLFDAGTTVTPTNLAGDPRFKNVNAQGPLAIDYFRIQPSSDAVDHADPASTMMTDIDGDARPQGNAPDIGADELN